MTGLTLEELLKLEREFHEETTMFGDSPTRLQLSTSDLGKLLAMARELIRIRSALDWLEANSGRPRAFWMPENIIAACVSQGWEDPTAPAPPVRGDG